MSVFALLLSSCVTTSPTSPSHKAAPVKDTKLTLAKGKTTKEQIIEKFGAPTIVTQHKDGASVWIYQKNKLMTEENGAKGKFTLVKGDTNQDDSMTVIVHFDKNGIVESYKSMHTSL
tara:strand:- start:67588 stop:67938 length:351 start_codon:yes stop_codon:yes gene_type:complete